MIAHDQFILADGTHLATAPFSIGDAVEITRLDATAIDHRSKPIGLVSVIYTKAVEIALFPPEVKWHGGRTNYSIEYFHDVKLLRRADPHGR